MLKTGSESIVSSPTSKKIILIPHSLNLPLRMGLLRSALAEGIDPDFTRIMNV